MPVIGIDLGNSSCCVAVLRGETVEVIPNELGNMVTPSCVAFTKTGRVIGEPAREQMSVNPRNTISGISRLFSSIGYPSPTRVYYRGVEQSFVPEELAAMILEYMKDVAERHIGEFVTEAVIAVPARFNPWQRQAMINAGHIAGLDVLQLVNNSTAAAITYGLPKRHLVKHNVLIFDLGSGSLSVSVVAIGKGVLEVLATVGDTHLGGVDFDERMTEYVMKELQTVHCITTNERECLLTRFRRECESVKEKLSSDQEAELSMASHVPGLDFRIMFTRQLFEDLIKGLVQRAMDYVCEALKGAKLDKNDVEEIIFVGKSSQIPKLQQLFLELFGEKPLHKCFEADDAIAVGAAYQAAILSQVHCEACSHVTVKDVAPFTIKFHPSDRDLLARNTPVPSTPFTVEYMNTEDYQSKLDILISVDTGDHWLYEFSDIRQAPRRTVNIAATFFVDASAVLQVSAADSLTGERVVVMELGKWNQNKLNYMRNKLKQFRQEADRLRYTTTAKIVLHEVMETALGQRLDECHSEIEKLKLDVLRNLSELKSDFDHVTTQLNQKLDCILSEIRKQTSDSNRYETNA